MRLVWSDDNARRLEFTAGFLGYEARIPILAAGFILIPSALFVMTVITSPIGALPGLSTLGAFTLRALIVLVVGVGGSVWLLRRVGRLVTTNSTLRYLAQVLRNELLAPRPVPDVDYVTDPRTVVWAEDKDIPEEVEYVLPDLTPRPARDS